MMGGRLEKAEEVGVPDELPKPDWMIEIDKEDWNDEQRKQGREFENKAKVYREELAKRRVLLAAELVRLHEESAETVVRHDETLAEFLVQKLAADQRVAEMEADVVALARETETALRDDEEEEERLALAADAAREARETRARRVPRSSSNSTPRVRSATRATRRTRNSTASSSATLPTRTTFLTRCTRCTNAGSRESRRG